MFFLCEKCWKKYKDGEKTTTMHKGNNPCCDNTYLVSSDDKQQTNKLRQGKIWDFIYICVNYVIIYILLYTIGVNVQSIN